MGAVVLCPSETDDRSRLDVYLAKEQVAPSRSHVQKLVADGRVTVNGRCETKVSYRVSVGDHIEVDLPPADLKPACAVPEDIPVDVLYEDADLYVVNKPRGMAVHPGAGRRTGTLVNALLGMAANLSEVGGAERPGIVHRLDRDTSGVLLVAKNDRTHVALSRDLAARAVGRYYIAIVRGNIAEDSAIIDAPIGRHPADRKKQAVRADGRPAVTHLHVDERYGDYTVVGLKLETGRTHQIRVHMQYIGRPVAGDPVYGGVVGELGLEGQALHAVRVEFAHPSTGRWMRVEAPMPDDMRAALELLRTGRPRRG